MSGTTMLALFEDLDPAANAIEKLHALGVPDAEISVISGVPVLEAILGRPRQGTNVSRLALGGAIAGFLVGGFLNFGTPQMYTVLVGGQPKLPIPPGMILFFEVTMLFMLLATFLGVFLESYFPNYRRLQYVPEISDGKVGVLFRCAAEDERKLSDAMKSLGAERVRPAEAVDL